MTSRLISLLVLSFCLLKLGARAQIPTSVIKWEHRFETQTNGEIKLIFTADIEPGWHIYDLQDTGGGLLPTSFSFDTSDAYEPLGKPLADKAASKYFDKSLGLQIAWFDGKVNFVQRFLLRKDSGAIISGRINFLACNQQTCLAPESYTFKIKVPGIRPTINERAGLIELLYSLLIGFGAGLLGLLTPCMYAMVPVVVGYFLKQSPRKTLRYALTYASCIMLSFLALGVGITVLFGATGLNNLATNIFFNLALFCLFVLFSLSLFGDFEIKLPAFLIKRSGKLSNSKNFVGIAFMALTLVLMSFSCTAPILGTLLVQISLSQNISSALSALVGFSLSIALPFGFLAAFPKFLSRIPKSGSWLNTLKVILAFIELALALKFLSNVDLAYHWNILNRDIFIALWVAIFLSLALFLLGFLKLRGGQDAEPISGIRTILGIVVLAFSVYLLPGLAGAQLKSVSGFLPPMESQEFTLETQKAMQRGEPAKYTSGDLTNDYDSYEEALRAARVNKKPIFINFTGHACINCRKMESTVLADARVERLLKAKFITAKLYVDDRRQVPRQNQGKAATTLGMMNSRLQIQKFGTNSQPFYAIIDSAERLLEESLGFETDTEKFLAFLQSGLARFNKQALD